MAGEWWPNKHIQLAAAEKEIYLQSTLGKM